MNEQIQYKPFNVGLFTYLIKGIAATEKPTNPSQASEAQQKGLTLLSRTTDPNLNKYRFNDCGCTQYIQPTHVRRGTFKCQTCFLRALVQRVHDKGCVFVTKEGCGNGCLLLIKPCGCLVNVSYQSTSSNYSLCSDCFDKDVRLAAKENGYTITDSLGAGRFRVVIDACQHTKVVHHQQVFRDNIVCRVCSQPKQRPRQQTANTAQTLPCGHTQTVKSHTISHKKWVCTVCKNSHTLKPTTVYLLHITSGNFQWLKLGFAKNIKYRQQMYNIKDAQYALLREVRFDTTKAAASVERKIHLKFKRQALPKTLMRNYMANGITECYPVEMLPVLLASLDSITVNNYKESNETI